MKRLFSILLALVLSVGIFTGCQAASKQPAVQEPSKETLPPVEDDGVMKILLIGHSLGNDSVFLFPDICKSEGVENMVVGFLYHSGCRLVQHLDYAKENARQYAYYEYDISKDDGWQRAKADGSFVYCPAGAGNDKYIEDGSIAQTLLFGIQRHDWDLVVLQGGLAESANLQDNYYISNSKQLNLIGYIQELMDYVSENDIEKGSPTKFAWNMVWSYPVDRAVRADSANQILDLYYGGDEHKLYLEQVSVLKDTIEPAFDWAYVFPNGTVIQNLKSSTWESTKIYRDNVHVTDFGRWAAAYTWYCTIFDKDITICKLAPMNHKVVLDEASRLGKMDLEWTQEQKDLMIEAVSNAMKTPYAMTQSKR